MKRVLLKLSGEALAGEKKTGFDEATVTEVAKQVKVLVDEGLEIGVVIGGGNFWRGRSSETIDRTKADQIGMLATVMNCIYVSEIFRSVGMKTEILTPFVCGAFTKLFSKDEANQCFAEGKVTFFAGGTGHPYFSTDTTTVLRAIEIEAETILLAKAVDGVYDSDPKTNPEAKKYDSVHIQEVIDKKLAVVDLTASILCMENKMPMMVFGLNEENSIIKTARGEFNGTRVIVDSKKPGGNKHMDERIAKYEDKMKKTLANLESEFGTIRAGRANPHVLDRITVDYYGSQTPLQQVANISVPEARMIQIQPWEASLVKAIEKAINMSDLGINPTNDGKVIRLVFPELTEERRKDLVKDVKKKGEAAKVAVRNIRRDANDMLKKLSKSDVSEDEIAELEESVQKMTDKFIKEVDKSVEVKSKEILTV